MHDQCYATMCIQSDSPGQQGRTWGKTEPHMFRLFAALLLNFTRLPLYVIHNEGVHPLTMLADALPLKSLYGPRPQVHPFKADVIKSKVRSPIRFIASVSPTLVVVLPSPAGVGLIAVTRISLPLGFDFIAVR